MASRLRYHLRNNKFRYFWDTLVCSLLWHDVAEGPDFGLPAGVFCVRCGVTLHRCDRGPS